jgi:hypothetical protein
MPRLWRAVGVVLGLAVGCLALLSLVGGISVLAVGTIAPGRAPLIFSLPRTPMPDQGPAIWVVVPGKRVDLSAYTRLGYRTIDQALAAVPGASGDPPDRQGLSPALVVTAYARAGAKVGEWSVPRNRGLVGYRGGSTVLSLPLYDPSNPCCEDARRIMVELDPGLRDLATEQRVQLEYHATLLRCAIDQSLGPTP